MSNALACLAPLACLTLALMPTSAAATPLSELAADLEPGAWAELPSEGLLPVISEQNGGATWSIFPYSEDGVWDQTTGQFFFIGSDHIYDGMSSGPRMIAYGDASDEWAVVSGIPWWGQGTMHGYDHSAMLDGRLYHMSLIVDMPVYRYDTSTQEWEPRAALPYTGYNRFGGLEPFPEIGGLVYVEGGGVFSYDEAADSWAEVQTGIAMGDYHNFAEYNPVHGVVLFGGGNGSGALHTIDADLTVTPRGDAPFSLLVNEAIVTVDPNSGDFLLFGGAGGQFLVYDVVDDELLEQDIEVPLFTNPQEPVALTIAGPVDSYGVVLFVKHSGIGLDGEASVWIYRHAPGMGTPPGGTTGPSDDSGTSGDDGTGDGTSDTGAGDSGSDQGSVEGSGSAGESSDASGDEGSGMAGSGDDASGCSCRSGSNPLWPAWLLIPVFALARRRRLLH